MIGEQWMRVAEYTLQELRAECCAAGRGAEFENLVDKLRSEGRWPFDGRDRLPRSGRNFRSV
jgi:hypothetical protein